MRIAAKVLALVGAVALAVVVTAAVRQGQARQQAAHVPALTPRPGIGPVRLASNPRPVPEFSVETFDGQTISSRDLLGKAVIVNFWATWCRPCLAEIPAFIALQTKYSDSLVIVGLSVDELPPAQVRRFATAQRISYPVAMASADLQERFGGIASLPTSFLVDRKGQVVQKHVGLYDGEIYEREVRALLDMPLDTTVEWFEDKGQVDPANAPPVTDVPDIGLERLTASQRVAVLARLNKEKCSCGCGLTLARCRVDDPSCGQSRPLAQKVVEEIRTARRD